MSISASKDRVQILSLAILILVTLGLRLHGLTADGLWYDELLSVTYAYPPLGELFESVRLNDAHPPLYYLQLHFWLKLGTSDLWLRLNGTLWGTLAVVSLYFVSERILGHRQALFGSSLLAVSPFAIRYAQEVRMYSLLMLLAIWAWFFVHQFLEATSRKLWWSAGLITVSLVFLYSHGAAFLFLMSLNCYVLVWLLQTRKWHTLRGWVPLQGLTLLLYLPWLSYARSIARAHLSTPSLTDVIRTFGAIVWGFGWSGISPAAKDWLAWPLFILVTIALLAAIIGGKSSERNLAISFVAAPAALCFVVSHLVRSIWTYRTLAYATPFLCLILVSGVRTEVRAGEKAPSHRALSTRGPIRWGITILALAAFASGLVFQKIFLHRGNDFRGASAFVRQEMSTGEVVFVPHDRTFWCWCWYFIGPGSVSSVDDEYVAVDEQGVLVASSPALNERPLPGNTYWLVYQENATIAPFDAIPHQVELAQEFRDLWVKRVRVSASE